MTLATADFEVEEWHRESVVKPEVATPPLPPILMSPLKKKDCGPLIP